MALQEARRKRRKELEMFYTNANKQTAFFKFLESPKTTCPVVRSFNNRLGFEPRIHLDIACVLPNPDLPTLARNFLFWLDVEAYRLQRRLAKSGGVNMNKFNDFEVCRTIYQKYVKSGAPYPIFMPNYTKLDITSAMRKFEATVKKRGGSTSQLTPIGEHVFDEAQNAVEVSLYRALTQFERELQQQSKAVDAVISTDNEGHSVFVTGSFRDLINWFLLDCEDERWEGEMTIFLWMYRAFETPQGLFEAINEALRNPDTMTTNSFDKDLIVSRSKRTLTCWITTGYYCDIEGDQVLITRILDLLSFAEKEYDDHDLRKMFAAFLERPLTFPQPVSARSRDLDLDRWSAREIAEQLTLLDSFQYYAMAPDEMFAVDEADGTPHLTTLQYRLEFVGHIVATAILKAAKPGVALKIFVAVLEQLFQLNNYNGVKGVLNGIFHPAVIRLKKGFKVFDKTERNFLTEIQQLMDTTHLYKKHIEGLGDVPCVPYTSTHLTLMSQAYSRNVSKIQTSRGINYQPMRAVAEVMYNFLRFQPFHYVEVLGLELNDDLYNMLMYVSCFNDEELMDYSTRLQPLDRKEKRGELQTPETVFTSPRGPGFLSPRGSPGGGGFMGKLKSPRPGKSPRKSPRPSKK